MFSAVIECQGILLLYSKVSKSQGIMYVTSSLCCSVNCCERAATLIFTGRVGLGTCIASSKLDFCPGEL